MSVINDMLRDLDKRHAPERSDDYAGSLSQDALKSMIEPGKKNNLKVLLLLLVIMLVLAWSVWFMFLANETVVISADVPSPATDTRGIDSLATHTEQVVTPVAKKVNAQKEIVKPQVASIPVEHHQDKLIEASPAKIPVNLTPKVSPAKLRLAKQNSLTTQKSLTAKNNYTHNASSANAKKKSGKAKKKEAAQNKAISSVKRHTLLSPKAEDNKMAQQASELFERGEIREAYRALYTFISSHELDIQSRIILASHLLSDQRLTEAGDVLLNATSDADPGFRQLKARWQVETGKEKLALITLQSNLPEIEDYPDYYVLLASYYQRFGYSELALKTYANLVQFDENVADWWAGLAIAAEQSKQWAQADFAYKQTLELPDLNPQLIPFVKKRISVLGQLKSH